mmetsp:Transcript_2840/g.17675  ORF Transcript_2840/g.17675 Transcript_2840/m.17675 type:complete len:81 (+) Transcript_2840:98-340(+)
MSEDKEKREQMAQVQAFIEQEKQKAVFNELVSKLTDLCWDKCVGTPGNRLSSSEQACLAQCAARFLDSSRVIMERFQQPR